MPTTLEHLNACPAAEFVKLAGPVFEHSPWIAEAAAEQRPFSSREALHAAMCAVVRAADPEKQLALIRAHPDLVGRAVLTAESSREQAAAGLMQLTPEEAEQFAGYNRAYHGNFGFPFVICARKNDRRKILTAMAQRLQNSPEQEVAAALEQVQMIAELRIRDLIPMHAKLSSHVLDLTTGRPAVGMTIQLLREGALIKSEATDSDGRVLFLKESEMAAGDYELVFYVGEYFDDSTFLNRVPVHFRINDETASYHVPLLCTPWSYSTYRGS